MSLQANSNNLLIPRGKWYFDRFDASGNPTGERFVGEGSKAEITHKVVTKSRFTTTKAANSKISSIVTQQEPMLLIELMEWTPDNVAMAFLGTPATFTQASASVTAEVFAGVAGKAAPGVGLVYPLANRNISAVTITGYDVSGVAITTPFVQGVDWDIEDAGSGAIVLLSTLAATAVTCKAAYTAALTTSKRISAGATSNITGKLVFRGDPTSGPGFDIVIWKAKISQASAMSILNDDFAPIPLTAEIIDAGASHPGSPFYDIIYR